MRSRARPTGFRKKKIGTDAQRSGLSEDDERKQKYQSVFKVQPDTKSSKPADAAHFLPPESLGSSSGFGDSEDGLMDLAHASAWDVATRYHEFKSRKSSEALRKKLRHLSASAILARAQQVLGSVVRPTVPGYAPMGELPYGADQVDIDLDETFENSPLLTKKGNFSSQDVWMSFTTHRRQPIVLSVDTSLSMTGEKLALTAVALAVVLLEFPEDPIGIVAFENEARILKRIEEKISIEQLIERFLDVPAQGYTHLEEGMRAALQQVRRGRVSGTGRPPSVVLLTDGKYTAGKDPAYLAGRFPHLVVLKMGKERASLELCKELAKKGHGVLREVNELESLPSVMYGVVKDLLRGRSLA